MALVQIVVDVQLAHVVDEIEIEMIRLAFFQLLFEDLFHLVHVAQVVAREFAGQIKAVPGIFFEHPPHDQLGVAVVVAPGGVVIVDALLHGIGHHGLHLRFVDMLRFAVQQGQPHAAHAQGGELQPLKVLVDHVFLLYGFPAAGIDCCYIKWFVP